MKIISKQHRCTPIHTKSRFLFQDYEVINGRILEGNKDKCIGFLQLSRYRYSLNTMALVLCLFRQQIPSSFILFHPRRDEPHFASQFILFVQTGPNRRPAYPVPPRFRVFEHLFHVFRIAFIYIYIFLW